MIYHITPVPKPRQTQRDKWMKRPEVMRYRAFAYECKSKRLQIKNDDSIVFHIEMPKSWSKKKRLAMLGAPHKSKPDLDNLLKSLMDASHDDDSHIHRLGAVEKVWGYGGMIEIY